MLENNVMKKISGKIILVDGEKYEKDLLKTALLEKQWDVEVDHYMKAQEAIEHLKAYNKEEIFLIISDMRIDGMSGLDFKKNIDSDKVLKQKAIPFIFASNTATNEQVSQAYDYRIQGYFKKPLNVDEQAEMLDTIIKYWIISRHPNKENF